MSKGIKIYSEEFKLKVINEVLSGKYTKEEARRVYGIGGKSAILYWIRKYSSSSFQDARNCVQTNCLNKMKPLSKEELKIQELENALEKESLRGDLLEKIVTIAEEQFNIEIRKKYGAKQFSPSKSNKKIK